MTVKFTSLLLELFLFRDVLTDAMFVWTAPHPAWNQTIPGSDSAQIHTTVVRVRNGSTNFVLRWSYRLEQTQAIMLTTFLVDDGINLASKIGVVTGGVSTVLTKNDYNNRFEVQSNAEFSSLAIKLVTERENTTFQCNVLLTDGNEWAYNVRIEVTVPPNIIHVSNDKTVSKSDEVSLVCEAAGYPIPTTTWTKPPKNKAITMPLMITGENDGGTYRCTADNRVGNPSFKDVFITVSSPPEIIKPSKGTWEVTTGESVNIECHARGSPRPQYVWRKAGGRVVVDGKLLHFQDVNTSHGGNYTCTAWNSVASANLTILINVQRTCLREVPNIVVTGQSCKRFRLTDEDQKANLCGLLVLPRCKATPKNIRSITTRVFVPEKEKKKTATDTSQYILIGVGSGGFLIVVIFIAVAVRCWRMEGTSVNQSLPTCSPTPFPGYEGYLAEAENNQEGVVHQSVPELYPPVDRSKKPKKKPKAGELHYADLDNFHASHTPTSPHLPFPILKKPHPYVKTEYAEITDIVREGSPGVQTAEVSTCGDFGENRETLM